MTIEVEIPPQLLERIERAAEAVGSDVPTLVRQAVESAFAPPDSVDEIPQRADNWIAELREWASRLPRREHFIDDSRDSIYGPDR
jgi:hypothetical protein